MSSAVRYGDIEGVRRYLALGANPNEVVASMTGGLSLVSLAVFMKHPDIAKILLEAGASPNPVELSEDWKAGAPFQMTIDKGDSATFKELLFRCPDAYSISFTPNGMRESLGGPSPEAPLTLWRSLVVGRHYDWLEGVLLARKERFPDEYLSVESATNLLSGRTDVPMKVLTALTGCVDEPAVFIERVAALLIYSGYLKSSARTGDFSQSVAKWALNHGATLEGCLLQSQNAQSKEPSSAISHLAAQPASTVPGLHAWIKLRSGVCALAELDAAVRSAGLALNATSYTLLAQARSCRPDGLLPLTPEEQSNPRGAVCAQPWLPTMLNLLLSDAGNLQYKRENSQTFLEAFRANPLGLSDEGVTLYSSLLEAPFEGLVRWSLTSEQKRIVEVLSMDWLAAGFVPTATERTFIAKVSSRALALADDLILSTALPDKPVQEKRGPRL